MHGVSKVSGEANNNVTEPLITQVWRGFFSKLQKHGKNAVMYQ